MSEPTFLSTKYYGHELGLSAVFRQWKANSHCNLLHGYSLAFKFTFEASGLDHRNWVVDFGGLKGLKAKLQETFDHKLVVADDDPYLEIFIALNERQLADVVILPAVGCEKFAEFAAIAAQAELGRMGISDRVKVVEVECSEHGANSAIYRP
jgi:6-pyruvoyltetrahydropterin/6-carboxytetrahydropterin synthase